MDFMCVKVQREYLGIASTGLHFSTGYDRCMDLTDHNFLDFAREHLDSNEWEETLGSWFEAAVLLIKVTWRTVCHSWRQQQKTAALETSEHGDEEHLQDLHIVSSQNAPTILIPRQCSTDQMVD